LGDPKTSYKNDIKVEGSTAGDEGLPSMKFCRRLSKRDVVTLLVGFRMCCSGRYKRTQKEFSAISCPRARRKSRGPPYNSSPNRHFEAPQHHNHACEATRTYIELKSRQFCGGYHFVRPPSASAHSCSLCGIVSINLSISS
jgi:hypothetical protein